MKAYLFLMLYFLISGSLLAQWKVRLKPETIEVFDRYSRKIEQEQEKSLQEEKFLRIERRGPVIMERAMKGEVILEKVKVDEDVPSGMIHDWIGTVYIPGATASDAMTLFTDYDRHKDVYSNVVDSRLLARQENDVSGFLKLTQKKVLTVVLNTEYNMKVVQVADDRLYLPSHSVRIAEIQDPGKSSEKELPVGNDRGLMWRLNSYWYIREVEDGILVECRSISLSRNIPWILGWIIRPFVEKTPRETLTSVLQETRKALQRGETSLGTY